MRGDIDMKKRLGEFFLTFMLLCVILVGCTSKNNITNDQQNTDKKTVYTTFFPVTYLTKRVVGDKMNVKTIIKGNQEPHSFDIQANDMKKILKSDLIIYNGANMESFIPALENSSSDKNKFLNLSQGLTLLEGGDGLSDEHSRVNPHTWLSIKNAIIQLDTIYNKLVSIDPTNESYYKENLKNAQDEFKKLDEKFQKEISKVKKVDKYFVVSHSAFNYLANDYGLKQIAVTGISPEEEPSAKQLKIIADFVKKHNITTIFFEGKATPKVAETLAENTNTKTSTLYTMENLTDEEVEMGYLKLMELNLEALIKSFND